MAKLIPIRVGICGCLHLYHDRMNGHRMRIGGQSFQLEEVRVPAKGPHTAFIKRHRCHIFIDRAEVEGGGLYILVSVMSLVRNPSGTRRSEKLAEVFYHGMNRRKKPKTPPYMTRQIRGLIAEMSPDHRQSWLERMGAP